MKSDRLGIEPEPEELLFKDNKTGELWLVGAIAQNNASLTDTKDSESSLFGRNRYFDPMFKVLASVGMGLALTPNEYGNPEGRDIYLQTGLPPAYYKTDAAILREVLIGEYDFSLRFGKSGWMNFKYEITPDRLDVIIQPMGTFRSICVDQQGNLVPEIRNFMRKNVLIFDPGFGTLDIFPIFGGSLGEVQTFDNLGMKEVLKRTADKIYEKYNVEVRVPTMQKILEVGKIKKIDRINMKSEYISFDDLLEESLVEVCQEAIEQLKKIYNYLSEIDYLVVTGGTGAAWNNYILETLRGMTEPDEITGQAALTIVPGNKNDDIPYILANARGYYMNALTTLNMQAKKANKAS